MFLFVLGEKMNYTKPFVAEYGNANEVIQGECGWGVENWTLDKTGGVNRKVYVKTILDTYETL